MIVVDCNNKEITVESQVESIGDEGIGKVIDVLDDNLVQIAYEDETVTVDGRKLLVCGN